LTLIVVFSRVKNTTNDLLTYERELWNKGFVQVAGIDEAGRGPLAGPVVAAAVIFPLHFAAIDGITDSKKLTHKKRLLLKSYVERQCLDVGVGIVDHEAIDELNILQATFRAMQRAVRSLQLVPDYVLVDGRAVPAINIASAAVIKGDGLSASIAAASIIAKVTRDDIMDQFHRQFPQYGFDRHKGYATPQHLKAIERYGLCPIHRRTFRPKILAHLYDE
jgi:ribonuclease HII